MESQLFNIDFRSRTAMVRLLVSEPRNGEFQLAAISRDNAVVFFSSPEMMRKNDTTTDSSIVVDACSDSRTANPRLNLRVKRGVDGTFTGQQNRKKKLIDFEKTGVGWDEFPFECKNLEELLSTLGIVTNDAIGVRYGIQEINNLWELYQTVLDIQKNPSNYKKLAVVRLKNGVVSEL